jgi:hypothetical protein
VRRYLSSVPIFLVAAVVTSVFFINFCATVYQCGCQWLWGDAARFCNIHAEHGKHCPWCAIGPAGGRAVWGAMLCSQAVMAFGGIRWGWSRMARLAASLAAFPASGLVLALVLGWYMGYWN